MNLSIFASRIKDLRSQNNLTLEHVGDAIGHTRHTVGNLENARKSPSAAMLAALADFYGVSVDYLMGRTDNPEVNK